MSRRSAAAFTTRPGIAACALDPAAAPRPLTHFTDAEHVATLLRERGMSPATAQAKAAAFVDCAAVQLLSHPASAPAFAFFVPGRIEVLGKHTDYCGGRSLLCTVERGFCLIAVPRTDARSEWVAAATGDRTAFDLSPDLTPRAGHWSNYPMTVARRVASNFDDGLGNTLVGADVVFASDLPQAAGLSSSSAFVVAAFMVLSAVNRLEESATYRANIRSLEDLANYLGCCENGSRFGALAGAEGVGTHGGSQDHTAILCCRPETLSVFSFCPVRREADVRLPDDLALHVCPSGVIAEKTGSAMSKYNAVSLRARMIVDTWNRATGEERPCLADVVCARHDALPQLRALLAADPSADKEMGLTSRLDQYLIESNRLIPAACRLIGTGAWNAVGPLVDESQALAETHLMNQVPETVLLQRQMRQAGAVAASAFGAGFGGSVWGLFRSDR